ncbi:hypothetical protein AN216_00570 [Streptomyces oceani]|uniref:HTH araC/xylS-type domain-containing protein n=1 Tax=Streptomyces oceani TaxID=1075402 RepID=A0A1E7KQ16_9ACTN|nr:hypothetical protein AN216_00570 [Streptomyces oceani]
MPRLLPPSYGEAGPLPPCGTPIGRRPDPAHVAAESGYFGQSHLHRNVQAFTDVTAATVAGELFPAVDDIA